MLVNFKAVNFGLNGLLSVILIIFFLAFIVSPWISFNYFGVDWKIHVVTANAIKDRQFLSNLSFDEFTLYASTPGTPLIYLLIAENIGISNLDAVFLISLVFAAVLLFSLILFFREMKQKVIFGLIVLFCWGLFELQFWAGSFHSQTIGFILLILSIISLIKRNYLLLFVFFISLLFLHLVTTYILILILFLSILVIKDKKHLILMSFAVLIGLIDFTMVNEYTSILIRRQVNLFFPTIQTFSPLLFLLALPLFLVFVCSIFFISNSKKVGRFVKDFIRDNSLNIKIILIILSVIVFFAGFGIYAVRHNITLFDWLFLHGLKLILFPLALIGFIDSFKQDALHIKLMQVVFLVFGVWAVLSFLNYVLPFSGLLYTLAGYPFRILSLFALPVSFFVLQVKGIPKFFYLVLCLVLVAFLVVSLFNPMQYVEATNVNTYSYSSQDLGLVNYTAQYISDGSISGELRLLTFMQIDRSFGIIRPKPETLYSSDYLVLDKFNFKNGITIEGRAVPISVEIKEKDWDLVYNNALDYVYKKV